MSKKFLYRYEEQTYSAGIDQFDNPLPGYTLKVNLHYYPIIKKTPKGVWIDNYGKKRFILLTAKKKFACETKKEALKSFIIRKSWQIKILSNQLEIAKIAKKYAENNQVENHSTVWD